jgi:hypothetical protein
VLEPRASANVIVAGVPLRVDEGADDRSFRLGLFAQAS